MSPLTAQERTELDELRRLDALEAKYGGAKAAPPRHPLYAVPERKPTSEESTFFKSRPDVAGMATDDDAIAMNPFSPLDSSAAEAVRLNERARVWMPRNVRPQFKITERQAKSFEGYGSEQDVRETIAARILSGDESAEDVTPEQSAWVDAYLRDPRQSARLRQDDLWRSGFTPSAAPPVRSTLDLPQQPPTRPFDPIEPDVIGPAEGDFPIVGMRQPEAPALIRALDPFLAFTGSTVESFSKAAEPITSRIPGVGGVEESLQGINPRFRGAKAAFPVSSGLGALAGSLPLIEASAGAAAGIPGIGGVPGPVREAVTGALFGMAETRDPKVAAQDALMFGGLGAGLRGAGMIGRGMMETLVPPPKPRYRVPVEAMREASGLPPLPKPRIRVHLEARPAAIEPGRQLGKSEAEAFPGQNLPPEAEVSRRTLPEGQPLAESSAELPKIQQEFSTASAPHQQGEAKPAQELPPIEPGRQLGKSEAEAFPGVKPIEQPETEYRGQHQAPGQDGAPAHDLTGNEVYPKDVYERPDWYESGEGLAEMHKIRRLRGNPDAPVWIYRAVPASEAGPLEGRSGRLIQSGDWVTTNKQYAKDHGESALKGDYVIASRRVTAKDIHTEGNSIFEWGYNPAAKPAPGVPAEGVPVANDLAKTVLDRPLTTEEVARQKAGARATAAFDKSLDVEGPGYKVKPPAKPQVEAETDAAIRADRDRLIDQGVPREEAHRQTVGLNRESNTQLREDFHLDALDPIDRKALQVSASNAKESGLDRDALQIADDILAGNRTAPDEEMAGLLLRMGQLERQAKELRIEADGLTQAGDEGAAKIIESRRDAVVQQIDKVSRAYERGGTGSARALSFMRARIDKESLDLVSVKRDVSVAKGRRLTPKEEADITKLVSDYEAAKVRLAEVEAAHSQATAEAARLKAESVLSQKAGKRAGIIERSATRQERAKATIADAKAKLNALGYRLNDVTGVSLEASYQIGRMALAYADQGITKLDEIVRLILNDMPELTARDVWDSMNAKDPAIQAKARSEASKNVSQLKTQARLLAELEDAERGVFAEKGPHWTKTAPAEIQALRKKLTALRREAYRSSIPANRLEKAVNTINLLQDQLENHYRSMKKGRALDPEELASAKAKINDLRRAMRVEDALADLNEQLRTGDFRVKEKPVAKPVPPEVEREQVLVAEARKKIRMKVRDSQKKWGVGAVVNEAFDFVRTSMLTADASFTLRQGLVPTARKLLTDPMGLAKNEIDAFKGAFSKFNAAELDNGIRTDPDYYQAVKAGLELPEVGAKRLAGEEIYNSRMIEKVPVWGEVVKASERHGVTLLNTLRWGQFKDFLKRYPNATSEELKAYATWLNVSTGRGDLGKAKASLGFLSKVLLAPRFTWSRIQTPNQLVKNWKIPRVRNEIAKDMVSTVALGTGILTGAYYAGLGVGNVFDVDNPDWGKIRVGNTTFDVWGGFQQPARLVARLGKATGQRVGGWMGFNTGKVDIDPFELIGRFTAYKTAPAIAIPKELLTGKTMVGQKVTPSETAVNYIVPLMLQSIRDAWKIDGAGMAGAVGPANFFGLGTDTYEKNNKGKGLAPNLPPLSKPPRLPAVGAGR